MDLFDPSAEQRMAQEAPLAARMRPRNMDEFIGQEQIVGSGRLLRRAIEADQLSSLIFFGPPGSGKTTLAQIIAGSTASDFCSISAVTSGIADIRAVLKNAEEAWKFHGRRTVLFIDEIHRFNKTQQDALLPAVENGVVILIGATTENPYFEVNGALLSRSRIFRLEALGEDDIYQLLRRAVEDERGMASYQPLIDDDALRHWASACAGDARTAYNALELAVLTTAPGEDGKRHIDLAIAEESIQRRNVSYDKKGDWHYDVISAFIKSMRGSDPDAALHWLARMMEAGEQPEFIARRIIICAAEDVGMADPLALVVAQAAADSVHYVGWPEARIALAEAAVYVATAPKSNAAYLGVEAAIADIRDLPFSGVPAHLRDTSYAGAKKFGHGKGYKYPHDFPGHYTPQQYLPAELENRRYYHPSDNGKEARIAERLQIIEELKAKAKKDGVKKIDKDGDK
ncbi:MAG: replication-associated recombination protein A [Bacillota bacterium]|nr:replication-associated recombination protein A [Bacillota bacterium]